MARSVISTQEDWRAVRERFPKAADDRKFVKDFEFDKTSVVRRTDVTVRDALPNASTTGSRWAIFERAITDGATVEEVNRRAREVSSPSSMPTRDADIFNALRSGYAVLEAGMGTKLVAEGGPAPDQLSAITADAVREATAEFDRIGRDEFLAKYGFGRARSYFLVVGGKLYDSKAIMGAARGYALAAAGPLKPNQFSGGQATVQRRLEELGFEVRVTSENSFSSEDLVIGRVYTRKDLAEQFTITDATLNTGVFRLAGSSSVWLFVTEDKTADRTQYLDHLHGDVLRWQGQTSGRTDDLIIEHEAGGLELLLFYRREKYEHEGAGFRYEGPFRYVDHHGSGPTSFVLRRVVDDVTRAAEAAETGGSFDPTSVEDARKRIVAAIVQRQGQATFRNALLKAYGGRCAITGCDVLEALEAAHIYPYQGDATNHVANGLLLRSDLHTLFDLGLVTVEPDTMMVVVASRLRSSGYGLLHGKQIELPAAPAQRPSAATLAWHASSWGLAGSWTAEGESILDRVESFLAQLGSLRRPGGHFREVSLGKGRLLAVDVFQSGAERGHVRVHLHGTIVRPTSPPPVVPSGTVPGCSACRDAPGGPYPASYTGPRGTREYFGFQWHSDDVDLVAIEAEARWLAKG